MIEKTMDCVVIGGGPAGMAAAVSCAHHGVERILIIERDAQLGGILNQCIHNGFGLKEFKEELTGPEYADRYRRLVDQAKIEVLCQATVLEIRANKDVLVMSPQLGIVVFHCRAIILAMGCRERSRGAIHVPGTRPAGIYSAGTAQRLMNLSGWHVGKEVVILGSGDIGLIMARRMTLEGAKVHCVVEVMDQCSGLKRNEVQCLDDFSIPLYLHHSIVAIRGKERVSGVTIAPLDETGQPQLAAAFDVACDTVLFSVGLIPENELTLQLGETLDEATKGPWVSNNHELRTAGFFACGNVLHVHDLVDQVSAEAAQTGAQVADYLQGELSARQPLNLTMDEHIRYVMPQRIDTQIKGSFHGLFRVKSPLKQAKIKVWIDAVCVAEFRRRVMTPGIMEEVTLSAALINQAKQSIYFEIEAGTA